MCGVGRRTIKVKRNRIQSLPCSQSESRPMRRVVCSKASPDSGRMSMNIVGTICMARTPRRRETRSAFTLLECERGSEEGRRKMT
jgi:hypothetical protein